MGSIDALGETLLFIVGGAILGSARLFGLTLVFPVFTLPQMGVALRGGIALALSAPLWPMMDSLLEPINAFGLVWLGLYAVKELIVGMIIGFILALPLWGVQAAAEHVDYYRGATVAQIVDPATGNNTGVFATHTQMTILTFFMLADGGTTIAATLYGSYAIWPIDLMLPRFSGAAPLLALGFLDEIFRIALAFGAPFLIAMFLGELTLIFTNQFARQINIFDLSLGLKNLIFVAGLPVLAYMFVAHHTGVLPAAEQVLAALEAMFQ